LTSPRTAAAGGTGLLAAARTDHLRAAGSLGRPAHVPQPVCRHRQAGPGRPAAGRRCGRRGIRRALRGAARPGTGAQGRRTGHAVHHPIRHPLAVHHALRHRLPRRRAAPQPLFRLLQPVCDGDDGHRHGGEPVHLFHLLRTADAVDLSAGGASRHRKGHEGRHDLPCLHADRRHGIAGRHRLAAPPARPYRVRPCRHRRRARPGIRRPAENHFPAADRRRRRQGRPRAAARLVAAGDGGPGAGVGAAARRRRGQGRRLRHRAHCLRGVRRRVRAVARPALPACHSCRGDHPLGQFPRAVPGRPEEAAGLFHGEPGVVYRARRRPVRPHRHHRRSGASGASGHHENHPVLLCREFRRNPGHPQGQ
jgi:hypothetical protein